MNKKIFIINGSGCVDCDTEFFNGHQWKKISDYQSIDKVLQYNKNGTAELIYPLDYIKNSQKKLNLFESKSLNMCLSDDHICYYITSKGNLYGKSFKEIKENFNSSKSGFNGKFITAFNYQSNNSINLTDAEIKLMIAIIADGHFRTDTTNSCYLNLKKESKKEEFRKICKEGNIDYTEKNYPSMPGYTRFFVKAPRHEKYFSPYWYNCSINQLKLIAENVLKWDENNKNRFFTNNKNSADFIQFVFASLGYNATITTRDRRNTKHYKTIEYSVIKSDNTLHQMDKDYRGKINEIKEYSTTDGYEYCFTVPSGMWIMRRNNKICITGNCVGKDTFVKLVSELVPTLNVSSVDKIKELAKEIEEEAGLEELPKTEEKREFLSDLKILAANYCDMPYQSMKRKVEKFKQDDDNQCLFLHIREPEEIKRAVKEFKAETILVTRDSVKQITSNMADANVYNYKYDYTVTNNGTIDDLKKIAEYFVKENILC